jgi:hypothetical protein
VATTEGLEQAVIAGEQRVSAIRESCHDQRDLLQLAEQQSNVCDRLYYELAACEWPYSPWRPDCLEKANERLFQLRAALERASSEYSDALEQAICDLILRLRAGEVFTGPSFTADVFSGLQFADMDHIDVMERVSQRVNSVYWHERMLEFCRRSHT